MFLAWREIKHTKLRYSLIALIMIMIIWLVLFVTGLANGLASDNASAIKESAASYFLIEKDSDNRFARSTVTEKQVSEVEKDLGKKATGLRVQMSTVSTKKDTNKTDVSYFSFDSTSFLKPELTDGHFGKSGSNEVVADQKLKNQGYSLGSTIKDAATNQTFKITGFTKKQTYSHTGVVFLTPVQWKEVQVPQKATDNTYNAIALDITEDKATTLNYSDLVTASKNDIVTNIPGYSEEQGSLTMMITFLYIIAAFVLTVFFYVITIQKVDQFGMLKAIGAKTSYLAKSLLSQIATLSVISLLIGNLLTYGVAALLPESMPFNLTPITALASSLLFLAVALIGSLLSLYRVAKVDAIEAIGGNN